MRNMLFYKPKQNMEEQKLDDKRLRYRAGYQ